MENNQEIINSPYSTVEKIVLGSIIDSNHLMQRALDMKVCEELFHSPVHISIWNCINSMVAKGVNSFDTVELVNPLALEARISETEAAKALNRVYECSRPIYFDHAVTQLHFHYRERKRNLLIRKATVAMKEDAKTDEDQRNLLDESISGLMDLQIPFTVESDSQRVRMARDRITRALESHKDPRKEYGWNVPGMDEEPICPISSAEMTIIGARPSTGKSSMLRQIAESLFNKECEDKGIRLIFTREVKEHDWLYQMASSMSGVPLGMMKVWSQDQKERWLKWYDYIGKAVEKRKLIIRHDIKTIEEVVKYTRSVAKNIGTISMFGLDYLQQYTSSRGKTRDESIGITTSSLKDLAMDLDIPVIVLSQLNREMDKDSKGNNGKDRPPSLSDLRESGNIEQDADKVLLLWRPLKNAIGGDNIAGHSPYEVVALKRKDRNRNQYGEVRLTFVPHLRRFRATSIVDQKSNNELAY